MNVQQQAMTFFAYDWNSQSLVFADPNGGKPLAISTHRLRELGWEAIDEGFRSSLPRFDVPLVQPVGAVPPAMNRAMRRMTRQ